MSLCIADRVTCQIHFFIGSVNLQNRQQESWQWENIIASKQQHIHKLHFIFLARGYLKINGHTYTYIIRIGYSKFCSCHFSLCSPFPPPSCSTSLPAHIHEISEFVGIGFLTILWPFPLLRRCIWTIHNLFLTVLSLSSQWSDRKQSILAILSNYYTFSSFTPPCWIYTRNARNDFFLWALK